MITIKGASKQIKLIARVEQWRSQDFDIGYAGSKIRIYNSVYNYKTYGAIRYTTMEFFMQFKMQI
jgi:hypothetical protein